ncbi:MAG: hypothetical protein A3A80_01455 [Candidatus Terrybacteria bacterium RIFCSPLOWO2_01_FULL_44_24]|uniref:Cell shape-determining protein MreC n=1 Tax=Candidatus Terrybacteria bacterium RIFCSPHIGHO2_01_FULL_43_35 TaxID=1802361 RepID=A0A1G2PHI4_9BACT|nr:MAG: hypothetical protein A2828_03830 [Candidatus Terrybacteria bacterium RIFCSPHIGHO2_01_FULL_43_35]OHA49933.1 MAG: hypothetical protein A3B75_03470 [Candidatus Terrybacteria bacterium RIFCSPHIGHO2_02_FULL_43_14]OHA51746.1 MAG: hypothetical protein A3A80_01455 [Candidatus Terrybacteria bacterium RIFCSPLOWO2_01_FULL_44_24]
MRKKNSFTLKKSYIIICAIILLALFYILGGRGFIIDSLSAILGPMLSRISYLPTRDDILEKENVKLRQENAILSERVIAQEALLKDKNIDIKFPGPKLLTRILWFNLLPSKRVAHINRGSSQGVYSDMVALDPGGSFLGKVINVFNDSADILLLGDKSLRISVRIGDTIGALEATSDNKLMVNLVGSDSNIEVGMPVYTAGQGDALPQGIAIGRVSEVSPSGVEPFLTIKVNAFSDARAQEYIFLIP